MFLWQQLCSIDARNPELYESGFNLIEVYRFCVNICLRSQIFLTNIHENCTVCCAPAMVYVYIRKRNQLSKAIISVELKRLETVERHPSHQIKKNGTYFSQLQNKNLFKVN